MNLLDQTVGRTALSLPGATRIFHAHHIDFCCGGQVTLREAAKRADLDPDMLDERSREVLGLADENEIVIFLDKEETD